ncbi:MAG TPA: hypothetical protein DF427_13010 [Moraxellaceae bacterium]|nr:hypothetical protein [Moraxellaceae bacterium]
MNDQVPVSPAQVKKNRLLLLLLLATFVVPFVVGDLAYKLGWYQGGKTNNGQLIDPPAAFAGFKARGQDGTAVTADFVKANWWLLYVMPEQCGQACRNRLFQMRQIRKALGKESERVKPLIVLTSALAPETEALLGKEFADFARVEAAAGDIDQTLARVLANAASAGNLFVMDPMGWLMLTYGPEVDEKTSVIKAEDVLNDLKKLLKASRIG